MRFMSEIDATGGADAAQSPTRRGRLGLWLTLVALAAASAGGAWYAGLFGAPAADAAAEPVLAPPIYVDIDSNMVVNFQGGGRLRYLQVGVQVMTRDPAAVEALQRHRPMLRNNLIMLFSDQSYEALNSRDGKAALRDAALTEVQGVLGDDYHGPGIEAVYFTSFVMQ
jgi:flagellar protein FliL